MKRCSTVFSLFFMTLILYAGEIQVSVTDRDLEFPLEGTMIQLIGEDAPLYTGPDGKVSIQLPADRQRSVLLISYPGYESVRLPVSPSEVEIEIVMVLAGFIEGEELVVERTAPGETEEETGVSVVMEKEEMDTTANIGLVEDVMSSIKTLPGVGYTSGWDAQPSIRGGYPEEMAAILDGFYVSYPFHWGGAYSIFNPNMVETAKLSHGIYSARYGRALSGILDITTKSPDEPEFRLDGSLSTTSADLFIQTPLGASSGLFMGGKVTYLDTARLLYPDEVKDITTLPYIRDFYAKWQYAPGSSIDFYLNGFVGSDGVGMDSSLTDDDGLTTDVSFDYDYINTFLAGGMHWSPTEEWYIDALVGVNWNLMHMEFAMANSGTRSYSSAFLETYGDLFNLSEGDFYTIDGLSFQGEEDVDLRQGQVKITAEKLLNDTNVLAFGTEQVLKQTSQSSDYSGWYSSYADGDFSLKQMSFSTDVEGNNSWNPAVFAIWDSGDDQSRLSSELGIRAEHYYIWNKDFSMNAVPTVNPRVNLSWRAFEDRFGVDDISFSFGSGIFSYFPMTEELLEEQYGIEDWSVTPDRALFNLVGSELSWDSGWKFSLEAYYKYYLNRLVLTTEERDDGSMGLYYNTRGKGHVLGFDLMLQKKSSRNWDGYLTYSFIYARYYNPNNSETADEEVSLVNGDPLDQWYYPYFHRFNSLNLVFNWHFHPGWTFSVMGSLASGAPREDVGEITMYPAEYAGSIIEQYARTSTYSDSLRDGISVPVDLRLAYGHYSKNSKVYTEWYIAVEDVFVNLYQPSTNTSFNSYTGEENQDTSADFNIGMPIPSFGVKVSY